MSSAWIASGSPAGCAANQRSVDFASASGSLVVLPNPNMGDWRRFPGR
jgi:hypothetical protein